MKKGQTWILNYLDTQFIPGAIKTRISDTRTLVEIEDMAGERMCLTVNVIGDIMDAETKRIIAESDVPHNLDVLRQSPFVEPKNWKNTLRATLKM